MSVRGAAMGGVSIDDPELNPASIASLKQPLVSVGGMRSSFNITRLEDVGGQVVTPRRHRIEETSLSHVYAALPVRNFVVGAYYRTEPRLGGITPFATPGAAEFDDSACSVTCSLFLLIDAAPAFERRQENYGVTAAWERGPLSIGVGAEMQEIDESYQLFRYVIEGQIPDTGPASRFDAMIRTASGRDLVPNAGIRWRVSPKIALAAAYNGGGTFDRKTEACTAANDGTTNCTTRLASLGDSRLKTAGALRASMTFTPIANLQLAGEVVRRNYSDLSEPYSIGSLGTVVPYRDVTELHAGAEYKLSRVALRAGWWRDPARYASGMYPFFPGRLSGDIDHTTFGAGIELGGGTRLDIALDDAADPALRRASAGLTLAAF
jgi:hypothetical protein